MKKKRSNNESVEQLIERLPELEKKIKQLIKENPDFQQMCQEYEEVADTLNFWIHIAKLPGSQINQQISENRELLKELETEILLALKQEDQSI